VGTAVQILQTLQSLGVTVTEVDGERLRFEPADRIPADLIPRLRAAKLELLEALRKGPAACSPFCYEVEPGRCIHHSEHGCKTAVSPKRATGVPQAECEHCDGSGACDCPACTLRRTPKAVPCLMCHPQERQKWLTSTVETRCWHCAGSKACCCIVCVNPWTGEAGECVPCKGTGRAWTRLQ
jgi:hypothetical protein